MVVWDFCSLWLWFILYYPPRGRVHQLPPWSNKKMIIFKCAAVVGDMLVPRRVPGLPIWSHKFWLLGCLGTGSNSLGLQAHKFPKVQRCDLVDSNLHVNKKESYQDGRKEVLLFMFFQHFSTTKSKERNSSMMQRYDIIYTWCQRKSYI